jgi:2-C-methyl-D-erythritol 4-phosphate cytidylyltransferase
MISEPQSMTSVERSTLASILAGSEVTVFATRVTDTVKELAHGRVSRTVPRETLADARGAWIIPRQVLSSALERAQNTADVNNLFDLSRLAHLRVRVRFIE